MDESRGQFTFYRSYYEALIQLPKKEREPVVMAICAYALDGEELPLSGLQSAIFSLIKPTLDSGRKRAANGKQGGSKPKANGKQNGSKPEAKTKQKPSEKEGEREEEREKEKESDSFIIPPTPLEGEIGRFLEFRKKIRRPMTDHAVDLLKQNLEKLAPGDDETKILILQQSIMNGWQGVFPLKDDARKSGNVFFDIAQEEGLL